MSNVKTFTKEMFSNRNTLIMTVTLTTVHFFNNLYLPWWPLYLRELGASIEIIGILFTIFPFFRFLITFPGGMLADRFGRKKIILIGSALRIVTPMLFLFARTWTELIPGLITNALIMLYNPPIYALILESLSDETRTTGFGVMQSILILASSITMPIGGIIMDRMGLIDGVRLVLTLTTIAFSIVFVIRYRWLSETLETKKLAKKPVFSPRGLQIKGSVLGMLVTQCLFWISNLILVTFVVIYATDVMTFTKTQWGVIQMAQQMVWAIATVPCAMFANRFGKHPAIFLSHAIRSIPMFAYIFLRDFNAILIVNVITGLGAALGGAMDGAAWQALITDLVPAERRARVIGLMGTVSGVLGSPFSYIASYLWESISPSATMALSGVFAAASALSFFVFVKESKTKGEKHSLE